MRSGNSGPDALKRSISKGSRFIVTGATLAVSAGLLGGLLVFDRAPSEIDIPGLSFAVPATVAHLLLVIMSHGAGWAGLAFLTQGKRLMWRMEFDERIAHNAIKNALVGSSLVSASYLLFDVVCSVSFLVLVGCAYMHSGAVSGKFCVLFPYPYLILQFGSRTRYLNPDNWSRGWGIAFMLRFAWLLCGVYHDFRERRKIFAETPFVEPFDEIGPFDRSEAFSSLETVYKNGVRDGLHTEVRRRGWFGLWLYLGKDDEWELDPCFASLAEGPIDEWIQKEFPKATTQELRREVSDYLICDPPKP